jgi:hypothetical protein
MMDEDAYVLILNPLAQAFLEAPMAAKDKWKYEQWAVRFERRYGVSPETHPGAEGTLYGVKIA